MEGGVAARHADHELGAPAAYVEHEQRIAGRQRLLDLTGGWTVPQIVIDGEPIGGYTELWRLDQTGALDARLAA